MINVMLGPIFGMMNKKAHANIEKRKGGPLATPFLDRRRIAFYDHRETQKDT